MLNYTVFLRREVISMQVCFILVHWPIVSADYVDLQFILRNSWQCSLVASSWRRKSAPSMHTFHSQQLDCVLCSESMYDASSWPHSSHMLQLF